jgi:hypothetical protein
VFEACDTVPGNCTDCNRQTKKRAPSDVGQHLVVGELLGVMIDQGVQPEAVGERWMSPVPIRLKRSSLIDERKFTGPLARSTRGDGTDASTGAKNPPA